jgi:hypothetical protein
VRGAELSHYATLMTEPHMAPLNIVMLEGYADEVK